MCILSHYFALGFPQNVFDQSFVTCKYYNLSPLLTFTETLTKCSCDYSVLIGWHDKPKEKTFKYFHNIQGLAVFYVVVS